MKYQKKPIVVEAIQYTGNNLQDICHFIGVNVINLRGFYLDTQIVIPTLEGSMSASISDYIIRGIKGEFYPIKEEIFLETYEKVEE